MSENHHRRRLRAYEFEHIVPWRDILKLPAEMVDDNPQTPDTRPEPAFVRLQDREDELAVSLAAVNDAIGAADERIQAILQSIDDDHYAAEARRAGAKDAAIAYRQALEEHLADEFDVEIDADPTATPPRDE